MYEDCPFRFLAHAVISSTEKIDPVDGKPGAQLTDFLPKTTYIDGVDQAGILLADNGESATVFRAARIRRRVRGPVARRMGADLKRRSRTIPIDLEGATGRRVARSLGSFATPGD